MTVSDFPDGLEALRKELDLPEIMRLIERTARWVDPATFRLLPLWYPEYARGTLYYNKDWTKPRMNRNRQSGLTEHKREGNVHASKALTAALGLSSDDRPNWSCCHIWGVDDGKYQVANVVVQDRLYFSCVANMVLLPSPLKAFTDVMPDVKAMLRICARSLYDWHCDHAEVKAAVALIDGWHEWDAYPASWPRQPSDGPPIGMVPLNPAIQRFIKRRKERIRHDLDHAGGNYPRADVEAVLKTWAISL